MKKLFALATVASFLVLCTQSLSGAAAPAYPSKPVNLIISVPPGGIGDLYGRTFGAAMERQTGQPVVVFNKPGAGGQLAFNALLQAPADGYTLAIFALSDLYVVEWETVSGGKPTFTKDDLAPIGSFTMSPHVLSVSTKTPWKTLTDLINDARAKPDQYAFGSGGMYSAQHTFAEHFMKATGLRFRHVPYSGGGPLAAALVGGHVDLGFTSSGSAIPLAKGNKLRILASPSAKRYRPISEVPTFRELGLDLDYLACVGILAPAKTPAPIMARLIEIYKKAIEDKAFVETVQKSGEEVAPLQGQELAAYIRNDLARFNKLYRQLFKEEQDAKKK